MLDKEILEDVHWKPDREEWLANAITEINEEIRQLELQKMKYQEEFERLTLNS